ncbi:putative dehydrodolichyl diphosphate synthase (dedol-pp synthase) [Schistosoma mansoni]|uniref:putative dehydrodolichyl diphosphate synthase (dedol-pp synthase) n=1 Tax=Schistosoma mansoni TaxID=6183 RepID=UPI0001A62F0B|nr:putative dehydrodolichyl diphosphate synthase (dedol-pp synthase) [Schistosoma mansoni]|eukprot:XP_018654417.1 putative dehydrodolichyl diphosphate synthase (dedol-pp synthase) [Schistosoma mansoni]
MTWTRSEVQYGILQKICLHAIKYGPIPKHVAFIMDGNRRFADGKMLKKSDGHLHGFTKLSETLQWCRDIGIEEVSIFTFSIDNFNRSHEEVSFLMNLAEEKLQELLDNKDELKADDICIRVIGNLALLPAKVQSLAAQLMLVTRNHSNDITRELLSKCLYTRLSKPLDLLIRTSGEIRLSDFLTWQVSENDTIYKFINNYWPEFSWWDFLSSIIHYQMSYLQLSPLINFKRMNNHDNNGLVLNMVHSKEYEAHKQRINSFLNYLDQTFWQNMNILAT